MPLGPWGKTMLDQGFNEVTYLGTYLVAQEYDQLPKNKEGDYEKLPAEEKTVLNNKFAADAKGNCGELANYFMAFGGDTRRPKEPALLFLEILLATNSGVFRIHLGSHHTFIGIRNADPSREIEILQAWQEEYSIVAWLNRKDNIFTVAEFIETLREIADPRYFSRASKKLCEVNGTGNLNRHSTISYFLFKQMNTDTCIPLGRVGDGHTPLVADIKCSW